MNGSTNHEDRPAKICKIAGRVSHGSDPLEFTGINKEKMFFDIHNFADLKEKRKACFYTKTIEACGHKWRMKIYPRGKNSSKTDAEYTSIYLCCADENIETNPVIARGFFRTKTMTDNLAEFKYEERKGQGFKDFKKRENIIQQDLNQQGTLTIEVEIETATEKREVWAPSKTNTKMCKDVMTMLYRSLEQTSDVTFVVGPAKEEIPAHKCVLAVQAKDLYDLVITAEESAASNSDSSNIILKDIDANAFGMFVKFVYGMLPDMRDAENGDKNENGNTDDAVDTIRNEEQATSILLIADRFGCTDLKLHMESYLIRNILVPSKAARLLLLADSYSCPLLKEAAMRIYITDPNSVKRSEKDWKQLQDSTKLLIELLDYATTTSSSDGGRTTYSSYIQNGNGTMEDADGYDVRSLRERLEAYELDLDGSRTMLLKRWKEYLLAQRGDDDDDDDMESTNSWL